LLGYWESNERFPVLYSSLSQASATSMTFGNTHFPVFAHAWRASNLFIMLKRKASRQADSAGEIRNELVRLFNEQTEFYRKGGESKHTKSEIAEFEKRRERVRALFAELEQLRKAA